MVDNPLIRQLELGLVRDEAGLKRLYRRLAVKAHPDSAGGGAEGFVRLKDAYDEACEWLRARPIPGPSGPKNTAGGDSRSPASHAGTGPAEACRRAFYRNFAELVAAGLPALFGPADGNPLRLRRRRALASAHDRLRPGRAGAIAAVEAELVRLRSGAPMGNGRSDGVRRLSTAIASWHYYPSAFARQAIERDHAHLAPLLDAPDSPACAELMAWLVADLAQGAALA